MPLRQYNLKVHKALLFSVINLVELRDFVPLWRKKPFRSRFKLIEALSFSDLIVKSGIKKMIFYSGFPDST